MKKVYLSFFLFVITLIKSDAQELFPLHEPASTLPKHVFGIRGTYNHFNEVSRSRNAYTIKAMYGVTAKFSLEIQSQFSNHHDTLLPADLLTHRHVGNQTIYYTNQKKFGLAYPTLFEGFYFYAKYRLLSIDNEHRHFRVAAFADYSTAKVAHDEAEPDLSGDNGGYGGGLIVTILNHRFASSLTSGFIIPKSYHETRYDYFYFNPVFETTLTYGKALYYDLSFGYLLYPKVYADYNDININIYTEFESKWYTAASIVQNGIAYETATPTLSKGNYIDMHPGIQLIFNSNLRIDLSLGFRLFNRSYTHFYPEYTLGIQRYFY